MKPKPDKSFSLRIRSLSTSLKAVIPTVAPQKSCSHNKSMARSGGIQRHYPRRCCHREFSHVDRRGERPETAWRRIPTRDPSTPRQRLLKGARFPWRCGRDDRRKKHRRKRRSVTCLAQTLNDLSPRAALLSEGIGFHQLWDCFKAHARMLLSKK